MTYQELQKNVRSIVAAIMLAVDKRDGETVRLLLNQLEENYEQSGAVLLGRSNRGKKMLVSEKSIIARRMNGKKGGRPKKSLTIRAVKTL